MTQSLEFDSLSPQGVSGRVILTHFPGLNRANEFSVERLDAVLQALSARGCRTLVSFAEHSEFELYSGHSVFADRVLAHEFTWHHLPIVDYQVPGAEFVRQWGDVSDALMIELKQGRDVCLHCKGGIGRSGTVAGLLLIDHGEDSAHAIDRVRQARPGAIETADQEAFVRAYTAAHSSSS